MNKIRIAICDDLEEYCYYMKNCIMLEDDFEFVGMAHNSADVINLCAEKKPDVLLLDMQMETYTSGADSALVIKEVSPETKIIILTIHNEDKQIFDAMANGVENYKLKTASTEEIFTTIRETHLNKKVIDPDVSEALINECIKVQNENASLLYILHTVTKLTTSEFSILEDLYNGLTYSEIAKKRYVESITIRSQASRILKKFNMSDMNSFIKILKELKMFDLLHKTEDKYK